jgi:hypothetical protein
MPLNPEQFAEMIALRFKATVAPLQADRAADAATIVALRERVALLEARALVPGPAGRDGKDGLDGKAGADGLGFEDMNLTHDGKRTVTLTWTKGARVKTWTLVFPVPIYEQTYVEGKLYTCGDCVTLGGSEWHCNDNTTTKPGESKAWTLMVKRGKDGRDGRDAATVPVVALGRP